MINRLVKILFRCWQIYFLGVFSFVIDIITLCGTIQPKIRSLYLMRAEGSLVGVFRTMHLFLVIHIQ